MAISAIVRHAPRGFHTLIRVATIVHCLISPSVACYKKGTGSPFHERLPWPTQPLDVSRFEVLNEIDEDCPGGFAFLPDLLDR